MAHMQEEIPGFLTRGLYSPSEADRLAGLVSGTTARWLRGYGSTRGNEKVWHPPVVGASPGDGISFMDLIELVAVGRFREHGFDVGTIRKIVTTCAEVFETSYPLASLSFKVGGQEVFVERDGMLVEVLKGKRRMAWDQVLAPFLDALDYENDRAVRWWPLGHGDPIAVDPRLGFGLPVVATRGVRTELLREQFAAGETIEQIAIDFGVGEGDVKSALQYESRFTAAA